MKFDVSSSALLAGLQSISKVIASKNTLPILDSFLFELEGNLLTLTAADPEIRLVTSVEVMNVEGAGSFVIGSKILLDPLKELPEQPLRFDINDDNLEIFIQFLNGKYNLIGQNADAYPRQRPLRGTVISFNMPATQLLRGVGVSLFATSDDPMRPIMNGIYFDIQPDNLTFVASDGHKLVRLRNTAVRVSDRASFVLPKKPAILLRNLLAKEQDTVSVEVDDHNARITCSSFEMVCRLTEGRYPNYKSVIPAENPYHVTLERVPLIAVLKRVSAFSNQSIGLVKLHIKESEMTVTAQDIDFSTAAEEHIPCEYDGDVDLEIGFKASYFVEILNNLGCEQIVLELADPSRAGLILPTENEEDEDLLSLLMPMMLSD